jgi:hypothetical protein
MQNLDSTLLDNLGYVPIAERYRVDAISLAEAREFFTKHHYCHTCGQAPAGIWGLFEGRFMIGALMFQRPGSEATCSQVFGPERKRGITGLHRLCILDVTPKNTESWFVARCMAALKQAKPFYEAILTFSDPSAGHVGTVYQAANARYYGAGKSEKRYEAPDGSRRTRRQCGRNISTEEAAALGWKVVTDPPKFRYVFTLAHGRRKTEMDRTLLLPSLPYPKHEVTSNGAVAAR